MGAHTDDSLIKETRKTTKTTERVTSKDSEATVTTSFHFLLRFNLFYLIYFRGERILNTYYTERALCGVIL